jgi:hypothetical protein
MENKKLLTEKASPNPPVKIGKLPPELYNQMSPQQQKDYDFLYSVYGDELYTNKNQYIPNSIKPITDKLLRDRSFLNDLFSTQNERNRSRDGLSYKELDKSIIDKWLQDKLSQDEMVQQGVVVTSPESETEFQTVPYEILNQMERDRRSAIDKRKTDLSSAISDQQKEIEAALQRQTEFEAKIKRTQDILSGKSESQELLTRTTKKVVDAMQGVLDKAPVGLFDRPEFDRRQPAKPDYNTTDPDYTGETARRNIPRTAAIDYDVTRSIPVTAATDNATKGRQEDEDWDELGLPDYEGLDQIQAELQAKSNRRILYPTQPYDIPAESDDPDYTGETARRNIPRTAATDNDATQGRKTSTNKSGKPREPIYPGSLGDIIDVLQGTKGSRGTPRDKDWSEQLSDILRGSKGTPNIPITYATDDDATKGGQRETLGTLPDDMKGGFLGQVRKQKAIQALTYEPSEAEIEAALPEWAKKKKTPTARERVFGVGGDVTTTEWYKQKQTSDAQRQNALDDLLSAQNRLKAYRLGDIKSFGAGTEQEKYLQRAAQSYDISNLADVPEDKRVQAYGNIFAKAAREYSESGINKEQIFNDVLAGKYSDRFTEGMSKGFERNPEAFARNYANRIAREQMKERKDEFKKSFRGTQYDPYVGADKIAKQYEYQVPSQPEVGPPDPGFDLAKNLRRAEKARSNTLGRGPSQEEQMFNFWNDSSNANYQADMLRRRLTADAEFAGQFQMQTGIAGIDAVKMSNRELNDIQMKSMGLGR